MLTLGYKNAGQPLRKTSSGSIKSLVTERLIWRIRWDLELRFLVTGLIPQPRRAGKEKPFHREGGKFKKGNARFSWRSLNLGRHGFFRVFGVFRGERLKVVRAEVCRQDLKRVDDFFSSLLAGKSSAKRLLAGVNHWMALAMRQN